VLYAFIKNRVTERLLLNNSISQQYDNQFQLVHYIIIIIIINNNKIIIIEYLVRHLQRAGPKELYSVTRVNKQLKTIFKKLVFEHI